MAGSRIEQIDNCTPRFVIDSGEKVATGTSQTVKFDCFALGREVDVLIKRDEDGVLHVLCQEPEKCATYDDEAENQ